MSLHNPALENRARALVGHEVEVVHARADMGAGDQPFHLRGVLRSVDGRFLQFDNGLIALSTVESIVPTDRFKPLQR